jgi:3-isopropylmalate/(R)-2-methylmalate dehydratase small subunit
MSAVFERSGRVWTFGDEVSIEYISPLRYMFNPDGRGQNCLKYLDPVFAAAQKQGDLIVAGTQFGQGPGHDHAILAIREAGIEGVVAASFAPQFFRHAIVHGLLVAECPGVLDLVGAGEQLTMDFATGRGRNQSRGTELRARVPEGPAAQIIEAGGLMPFLRAQVAAQPG